MDRAKLLEHLRLVACERGRLQERGAPAARWNTQLRDRAPGFVARETEAIVVAVENAQAISDVRQANPAPRRLGGSIESDAVVRDAHDQRAVDDAGGDLDRAR